MSIRKARFHLHELECEVNSLNNKVKDLQKGIVLKSETIARLEKIKEKNEAVPSPFPTAALFNAGFSGLKLKPTKTKVSNENAFPEVEKESAEASEIKPWLYLGGNLVARNLSLLKQLGINRILNTASGVCPNYFESDPYFRYTSFELIDSPTESIDHFILHAIAAIENAREEGGKILVHCHQGVSRSATLVTAYIAWKENLPILDALMYVKARRKIVSPNAGFLEQLKAYEIRTRPDEVLSLVPTLHHVTYHSDNNAFLVVKRVFDPSIAGINTKDIFMIHEGLGGKLLIREAQDVSDKRHMETALRIAEWMIKYEKIYRNSSIEVVSYDNERFFEILSRINKKNQNEKVEYVDSSKS